jgi:Protein of unknown function (DUF2384)
VGQNTAQVNEVSSRSLSGLTVFAEANLNLLAVAAYGAIVHSLPTLQLRATFDEKLWLSQFKFAGVHDFDIVCLMTDSLHANSDKHLVLSKAAAAAAIRLGLSESQFAALLGFKPAEEVWDACVMSRLDPETPTGKRAVQLVRLHVVLEQLLGSSQLSADWMRGYETTLQGVPLALIESDQGFLDVLNYLEGQMATPS